MIKALPRFGKFPFLLLSTPLRLQQALEEEYGRMVFEYEDKIAEHDPEYKTAVLNGISSVLSEVPNVGHAPVSQELMNLAYEEITPLLEDWSGCELERSWGFGIRSYGPGSVLHVHRDRVDTHVVSCIIHVDDQASNAWPLDFIDHEGEHHSLTFENGTMLFYESLCPHGRATPFQGDYYRNMYLHWRPKNWDPLPYRKMKVQFSDLQEAQEVVRQIQIADMVPSDWIEWLQLNLSRGCDPEGMISIVVSRTGVHRSSAEAVLQLTEKSQIPVLTSVTETPPSWMHWYSAPITRSDNQPRAWKLDSPLVQLYEIPDLLSRQECCQLIEAIDLGLIPSTVTRGDSSYRTSRTCHLRNHAPDLSRRIDERLASLLGVNPIFSETIQGQRYDTGQYFKEHTDWFEPGTPEFEENTRPGGQRTWTIMVYLNYVVAGGETLFRHLGRTYMPITGFALAWNNLWADGTPNPFTLHEALPVEEGSKYVITKWFRAAPGRNTFE